MNTRVHNPHSRAPRLHVSLTVEEVQQLKAALDHLGSLPGPRGDFRGCFTGNMQSAFFDLLAGLNHALVTPLPKGIKGVAP
jgi:hypothetical protein